MKPGIGSVTLARSDLSCRVDFPGCVRLRIDESERSRPRLTSGGAA
jgi:hypothetical protein